MAIRIIREDGDPVLRKQSRVVEQVDDKIKVLVDDMIETMYEADGVGLAAPQIGILKRIIVLDIYDDTGVKVLINPEILEAKGEQVEIEGCLSIPGESGMVKRPAYVKVTGLNRDGDQVTYEATELLARAFCHEIDHLNGVLFTDKVINEGDN
jgi:peptide deformylase